ncbi:arylsulfatase [Nocardioides sp. GY 10113]|uniref:sulfatase-like hydrolase/transferase n=1 Tax=Nocardioides sp. GY 10113 TaxID=2569761 RepID=UPI0010A7D69C|nr:sulfatase-like hydrolase/transferase [Nocardioides sp. GY 10113]TIC89065.1 arylsulfatase [Nocardioides sp. GY 10113]
MRWSLARAAVAAATTTAALGALCAPVPSTAQAAATSHATVARTAFEVPTRARGSRPNVMMITVDDAAPGDLRFLPKTRKLLGESGTTLTNAIAPTPLCAPARASLLTGKYAHNHGTLSISGKNGGLGALDSERNTLPVWLQAAGYDTLFVGKYLNGYGEGASRATYVPPGWTDWRATIGKTTYNYMGHRINLNGKPRKFRGDYSTTVLGAQADDMLTAPRRTSKPWYLWLNYVAPHHGGPDDADDPTVTHPRFRPAVQTARPAKKYRNTLRRLALPRKPNMFASTRGVDWSGAGRSLLREAYQQRGEALRSVDDAIAKHVRILKRTGMWKQTVVIFASDNGYSVGEHNHLGKNVYWREETTVPTIITGPGVPSGITTKNVISQLDLVASIVEAAGATPGRSLDGEPAWDLLAPGETEVRTVGIEAWPVRYGGLRANFTGVRKGDRWTYVRMRSGREFLYDHDSDPYELRNLRRSEDPAVQEVLAQVRADTDRLSRCDGADCRDR